MPNIKPIPDRASAFTIIFLLFALTMIAVCQEQKDTARKDSTSKTLRLLQLDMFQNNIDFAYPSTPELNSETFPAYLRQSLSTPLPTLPWRLNEDVGVQGIWKQELARRNEYKTFKMILGSMQTGATAYLLYKHLKKYGLR